MKNKQKQSSKNKRSPCPIACTLDIMGDKWTLLIIRDLLCGKKTYSNFQESPEKIPSNILADRLKRLVANEIVEKKPYQMNPVRYKYVLTRKGKDLGAVLKAIVDWGEKHIPGSKALMIPVNNK